MEIKTKASRWDLIELKNFCIAKETIRKVKKQRSELRENNSKWNNWQRINFQNTQAAPTTQCQKNKQPNQKVGETQTDISPKKTYRWLTSTWKDAQHHSLLEKCKSKVQSGIMSHQSEWPSSESLQTINAGEGVDKREHSCSVGGDVNWYSHFGRRYGDSLKD